MATHTTSTPQTDALLGVYKKPPMEFVRGAGVHLYDADGKSYLDFVAGIAVNALGYGDAGVDAAMREAMATGILHTSNLYRTSPGEQLADKLVARTFADRVFYSNSGAEANEGAFKIARRWGRSMGGTAKHEIVSLRGAFHGRLMGTLAATDRPSYRAPFRPLAGGISIMERDLDELAVNLRAETVAAVIAEPIQGEGGVRVLDTAFLQGLRALTQERNIALILDEIQCGYGRTGTFMAHEHWGITPDILTVAKPMAAGLPMGAVLTTKAIAEPMQPGDHGTTFGGGPFVAAVGNHVFDRLSDPALLAHVTEQGNFISARLHGIAAQSSKVRAVRGMGFMWGVDVVDPAKDIIGRCMEAGMLVCSAGEHTLRLLPPLVMTRDELERGLQILELAIG
ncbi:acetylornithine/succinylornithine family transaminase [bacterium]|jgi:acetylornithine/N-succinyldiaminopimelate aminotransferase|nr:acetylornithine/succinylornithine family transaminase [bacterium]